MAAATPPSPIDWTWPPPRPPTLPPSSPPLELQLLPPAPFTPSDSPWGLDPSRLQQLMMGSVVSPPPPASSNYSSAPACNGSARDLGALFDDNGAGKPLPSGWERCLDLQSGKMFLKKCDAEGKCLQNSCSPCVEQRVDWMQSGRWPHAFSKPDQQRQDWSPRWEGEIVFSSRLERSYGMKNFVDAHARCHGDMEAPSVQEKEPVGLDLELKLTNGRSSNARLKAEDATSLRPFDGAATSSNQSCVQESIQQWKWQESANGNDKTAASIQEMARESTMVTAVCSKCLMYVLLRKSNPICPRCSAPITLEGVSVLSSCGSKKRPRLDLSPDVLSLSTDSSR